MLQAPVTMEELMNKRFPEQQWVVDSLIPASAITILSGPPANFKTWVLLHVAICVSQGAPVFGEFPSSKNSVMIIDEENGDRLLQQRLHKLNASSTLPIHFHYHGGFTLNDETVDKVMAYCREEDIKLLIIDSLVRIHSGDENKAGDMAEVFKYLRRFCNNGIAILLTHHNRKPGVAQSGGNEMRGSSDILASIDSHIGLTRKESTLHFHQTKQRYTEELKPFKVCVVDNETLTLHYGGNAKDDDDYKLKEMVLKLLADNAGVNQLQLSQILDNENAHVNEHKLRKILKELVSQDVIVEERGVGKTLHYSLIAQEETA